MTDKLPDCCIPRDGASAAEILYCAYQRGGAPDRAGLSWDGRECPTWAEILGEAFAGDIGKQGVVAKWNAVVHAVTEILKSPPADDGLPLPYWIRLGLWRDRDHKEGGTKGAAQGAPLDLPRRRETADFDIPL